MTGERAMMKETQDVVTASGLTKVFGTSAKSAKGETLALDRFDIRVPRGQLTALVGPDGAGKTTFMRLVCGLLKPTSGSLQVTGLDVTAQPQQVQERLSYMPQRFGLYEDLTVAENMDLYANLHGVPRDVRAERFRHLLKMTDLAAFTGRLAGRLSGGMKQKLGLACTLVRSPELLLLDEPTVGVDPLSRRELWEILLQLVRDEQLSVLVSTAYMEEAARCALVYVLNRGHILAKGSPEDLQQRAAGLCYAVKPPQGMAMRVLQDRLLSEPAVLDAVPSAGQVRFTTRGDWRVLPALQELDLTAESLPPRLEDAFMLLLKDDEQQRGKEGVEDSGALLASSADASTVPTAPAAPAVIAVRDLVKQFGDFTAVSHTSFDVHQGEVFGLLGPNGAGKTTTFRMLCGLLPATSGRLEVAGVDLRRARTQARARIGYVAQKFSLYGGLSVYENLRFFGGIYGLYGRRLRERIERVMEEFGLVGRENVEAAQLPGGYKQRLSMAAALIHDPPILFLDEPTSGIDPLARRTFWQQITHLSARGTTIIITTHFMEEAEYCDRFMIQDHGKLLVLGTPAEIRTRFGQPDAEMDDLFVAIVEHARGGNHE